MVCLERQADDLHIYPVNGKQVVIFFIWIWTPKINTILCGKMNHWLHELEIGLGMEMYSVCCNVSDLVQDHYLHGIGNADTTAYLILSKYIVYWWLSARLQ